MEVHVLISLYIKVQIREISFIWKSEVLYMEVLIREISFIWKSIIWREVSLIWRYLRLIHYGGGFLINYV